ncbi:MAG: hypothetical protein MUE73_14415, partial [Planctomycetes bacterium]|nr:hypothetical protein [Planctomycetota bacterium]
MLAAVPLFGTRVAPRMRIADGLLVATIADGAVESRNVEPLDIAEEEDIAERLVDLRIGTFVCGGLRREVKA